MFSNRRPIKWVAFHPCNKLLPSEEQKDNCMYHSREWAAVYLIKKEQKNVYQVPFSCSTLHIPMLCSLPSGRPGWRAHFWSSRSSASEWLWSTCILSNLKEELGQSALLLPTSSWLCHHSPSWLPPTKFRQTPHSSFLWSYGSSSFGDMSLDY